MLKKLLKYDIKWTYKNLIVFYTLAFVFSILTRIFLGIENKTIFNIIGQICSGISIALFVNIIINCSVRCWARFKSNIYGDESYLTHTLPVERKTVYKSKSLLAVLSIFTSVIVILICLFICYYSKEALDVIKNSLYLISSTYDITVITLILFIAGIFLFEILTLILLGYTGIILGHRFNYNKTAKSVIISILLYFAVQALTLLIIFIIGLINPDIMNLFTSNQMISIDSLKMIMTISASIYLVYVIVIGIINKKLFCKGVNVD